MVLLLIARTVQGLGSGLLLSGAHGLVRDLFPAASWSRAFALISAVWGIAALAGPLIGGVFAAIGEWRLGFIAMLPRSEEHTSELQSLMRISYAVFCLTKKTRKTRQSR